MQTRVTNKKQTGFFDNFGPARWRNHLILLGLSVLGNGLAYVYEPTALLVDIVALGTGYVALLFLVATLSIGPLNLILKRKNAVNLDLRRDVGIWTGITATVHAAFSFLLYNNANVLLYFFNKQGNKLTPQFNLFGLSNVLGVLAEIIMLVLLHLSNNLSLRLLKGKRWKFFQRFNYPLFVLTIAHTIGYQVLNTHTGFFNFLLIAVVFFTIEAQLVGVILTLIRDRKREAAHRSNTPVVVAPSPAEVEQNLIARRRFLVLSGVTIVSGIGSIVALNAAIATQNQANATQAQASNNTVAPTSTASNPSNAGSSSSATASPSTTDASNASSGSSDTAGATAASNGSAAANSTGGTVLANLSSLPVGACTTYTTPDSGDTAFLIHEQDGSVKSFSNICTHRPYQLTYDQSQQAFYCPLHGATFDINSGEVTGGPARYGLQSFKVQVNKQGQVVYIQS